MNGSRFSLKAFLELPHPNVIGLDFMIWMKKEPGYGSMEQDYLTRAGNQESQMIMEKMKIAPTCGPLENGTMLPVMMTMLMGSVRKISELIIKF